MVGIVVENNFLRSTSSAKRDELAEKVLNGDKSLQTAKEFLQLENVDKRSDALVAKFNKEPQSMTTAERTELLSYLKINASEMQIQYGEAVTKELIVGMLAGQCKHTLFSSTHFSILPDFQPAALQKYPRRF